MGSIDKTSKFSCNGTICHPDAVCSGHVLRLQYSTVTDIGHVDLDRETIIGGSDDFLLTLADLIKENVR